MPIATRWAYFDHAAVAPLPRPTVEAMTTWCQEAAESGDTVWPQWNRDVQETRRLAAQLIAAQPEEIALVPNTTAGISLVAEGFPWRPGDNVVTLANEFPSNLYPWMNLAARGVETRRVPVADDGRVRLEDVLHACDPRSRIVALSWIGFAKGSRISVAEFADAIHQRGAYFFLDAIQGLGVFPLDVRQAKVDFLAADGHKWMLGPEGAGIFYLRAEHLDLLRTIGVGWNSVAHCYDFSRIELNLKDSAARFEGGTLNTSGFLGLGASLRLLAEQGLTAEHSPLATRVLRITDYACQHLSSIGAQLVSPRDDDHRSGIVAFRMENRDPDAVRQRCLEAGIVLSRRDGCLRISPHAYNNEEDIDHLIDVLRS